jgi:serine/threonine protein kinase
LRHCMSSSCRLLMSSHIVEKTSKGAFWRGARGVRKAGFISRHLSSNFLARHYEVVRRLGIGSFGHVDLVRRRSTDELFVAKIVNTRDMEPVVVEMMRKEIQVLSALDHPNIIKLFEFVEDEQLGQMILILEYVAGGDCLDLLGEQKRVLPEKLVAQLIYQLLEALSYCHSRGIAHRDVKPENLMLSSAEEDFPEGKVIDFGLATPYKSEVKEFAGTVSYLSPELAIAQAGFSTAADIWAVGVTTFELLAGVSAFGKPMEFGDDSEPVLSKIREYEDFDDDLLQVFNVSPGNTRSWRSTDAKNFLRMLLKAQPEDRPTALEALQHPWLRRHAPQVSDLLTAETMRHMVSYASAPVTSRGCLFALAAKSTGERLDVKRLGRIFVALDQDGDGEISAQDLSKSLAQAQSTWWHRSEANQVDMESVLKVTDQGPLMFTDFVAANLSYTTCHRLDAGLAERAFEAMDHDNDGLVFIEDFSCLFPRHRPRGLPTYRPFSLAEWQESLRELHSRTVPREAVQDPNAQDSHRGLFSFFSSWLLCNASHVEDEEVERFQEPCQLHVKDDLQDQSSSKIQFVPKQFATDPVAAVEFLEKLERDRAASKMAAVAMVCGPPDPLPLSKDLIKPISTAPSFGTASTASFLSLVPGLPLPPRTAASTFSSLSGPSFAAQSQTFSRLPRAAQSCAPHRLLGAGRIW